MKYYFVVEWFTNSAESHVQSMYKDVGEFNSLDEIVKFFGIEASISAQDLEKEINLNREDDGPFAVIIVGDKIYSIAERVK